MRILGSLWSMISVRGLDDLSCSQRPERFGLCCCAETGNKARIRIAKDVLLISESLHRICTRGAPGRDVARNKRDHKQEDGHRQKGYGVAGADLVQQARQEAGQPPRGREAESQSR